MTLTSIVALLQTALMLLGIVSANPSLPQATKDNATQVAQQAISQATTALASSKATESNSGVSVPGMSQYTDKDFGFSFWYPSGWTVTNMSEEGKGMFAGTTDKAGNLSKGRIFVKGPGVEIDIDKVHSDTRTFNVNPGACGSCGPVTYYFDVNLHQWMKVYPNGANGGDVPQAVREAGKIPRPADISNNTMGGLHIFLTEQKESAAIVPLSAKDFLIVKDVTYTQQCGSYCDSASIKGGAQFLAKTILATDPSVATPVSQDQQIATIKAEQQAYVGQ